MTYRASQHVPQEQEGYVWTWILRVVSQGGWNMKLVKGKFINMGGPYHDTGYKTLASILRGINTMALRSLVYTK